LTIAVTRRRRVEIVARRGAALRSRARGSQDELRCGAIREQRPYRGCVGKRLWVMGEASLA
jgi:hypothetical protein